MADGYTSYCGAVTILRIFHFYPTSFTLFWFLLLQEISHLPKLIPCENDKFLHLDKITLAELDLAKEINYGKTKEIYNSKLEYNNDKEATMEENKDLQYQIRRVYPIRTKSKSVIGRAWTGWVYENKIVPGNLHGAESLVYLFFVTFENGWTFPYNSNLHYKVRIIELNNKICMLLTWT